jgi:multidrug transporter EmrE-like cation transporter
VKAILLALSAPVIGTAGQLLLKKVMTGVGAIGSGQFDGRTLNIILTNPLFYLAVLLYGMGFIIWLVVLSRLQLSYAYPILALSFFLVPLFSRFMFDEPISLLRWVGIGIICCGVAVVGFSK